LECGGSTPLFFHQPGKAVCLIKTDMPRNAGFWRNVILIALAHVALIAGLIRWSAAAKAPSNAESIVWLSGAGDLAADDLEEEQSRSPKQSLSETESRESKPNETPDETPVLATAKSEIELPSATPKPTPTATPAKPTATPALKAKTTPKPTPKSSRDVTHSEARGETAKKTLPVKPKPGPAKSSAKSEKKAKNTLAKNDATSHSGSGSTDKAGSGAGGSAASQFGWYGNMLHDRFYSAWIQPTANIATGTKISTLVKVRIEKDGRVSKFEIIKPSENAVVNESVRLVAKQVSHVDAPPTGLIKGDHYDVNINFELNTEEKSD
jgi:TonB family protein